ncbi:MAG: hypothetical protein F6K42_27535 [Leptolyngbya sp. SIO1D8]|nr:hypothetical protein [Leptolyngbya sp. SIO1D8]
MGLSFLEVAARTKLRTGISSSLCFQQIATDVATKVRSPSGGSSSDLSGIKWWMGRG